MAKKKTKKVSKKAPKKSAKKVSRKTNKSTSHSIKNIPNKRRFSITKLFWRLIVTIIIAFGFYKMWTFDMYQGLSIVVLGLVIFLIAKLIENIRKK